ncbi:ABC transporter ATP-binding protein [Weissella minor]|uniref:ABC antimicrobial peptide transporter ATPase n=1 Tax=Weissella minor TaxID=1620 RepID=A0A0R2JFA3_9LACO|nr:ABC transporter ATP-binding protein [Weissella minor]KRN76018.1 ABC antimicrobial peptide transporter ATPase [Weissella minor]
MKAVIQFEAVHKCFSEQQILKNSHLSVFEGEFVALVGPSGSGKSTILNMMGLLDSPDSGQILIDGKKAPAIDSRQATKIRRNTINYLFQSFALIEERTVQENLLLAMHFTKQSQAAKAGAILQVLKLLELDRRLHDRVNVLSGGEKQRIALARAFLKPGDIILADEPTGALDPLLAEKAFELLQMMQKKFHKTLIMVTHNVEQANRADRIINMQVMR